MSNISIDNKADLAVEVGTPVMVTADGWVSRIANDPDGWGLFMDMLHPGSGYLTRYAHLSAVHVPVGTFITKFASEVENP